LRLKKGATMAELKNSYEKSVYLIKKKGYSRIEENMLRK